LSPQNGKKEKERTLARTPPTLGTPKKRNKEVKKKKIRTSAVIVQTAPKKSTKRKEGGSGGGRGPPNQKVARAFRGGAEKRGTSLGGEETDKRKTRI